MSEFWLIILTSWSMDEQPQIEFLAEYAEIVERSISW
jgi:hypothetical protein